MKKLLLVLFAVFSSFICPAQFNTYHPFPHTNAVWCQTDEFLDQSVTCWNPNNIITSYYDFYVNGDTVVNSKTYFKVRKSGASLFGSVCPPSPLWYSNDYDFLAGLLREDTT